MKKIHGLLVLTAVWLALVSGGRAEAQGAVTMNSATNPVPRDAKWVARHEGFVHKAGQGGVDLLFMGDSITDWFPLRGSNVWSKFYGSRRVADFGIAGDRTEHVLWRIDNGELAGISPKVVVLMIGTNNKGANTSGEIVQGITLIVQEIHQRLPESKILLLGVFPCGQRVDPQRDRLAVVNAAISKLDGQMNVTYLDIGQKFLEPDGTLSREIMPDLLHPSMKGYQIWAEAIEPTLVEMLK